MAYTQVASEQSQPLFLRVNNRNAASRALNAIRAENYAERTQQTQLQTQAQTNTTPSEKIASTDSTPKAEADDFGFEDLLDMVNPLHHIPVVSTLYQDLTGDTISAPSKIVGGGIFGGITGLAGSLVDAVVEEVSGLDLGHHVLALFRGDEADDITNVAEQKQTNTQTADLATNPALQENPAYAQMQTPKNTGGIQLTSYATPEKSAAKTSGSTSAQPDMPELQERIKDPKAAWSNRPNLSPTAFNALLASFEDTAQTAQSVAQQVAPKDRIDNTGTKTREAAEIIQASTLSQNKYTGAQASTPINDLLTKMKTGLDKYDQSKDQALRQATYQSIQ